MNASAQIAAARRYAPPLFIAGQVDRRGAKLRQVNRRAVDYALRAGMTLEDVYPGGLEGVRALAPPRESREASAFVRSVGLRLEDVYPAAATFAGEEPKKRRWKWVAVGALIGAVVAGPLGAVVGAAGGLIGAAR